MADQQDEVIVDAAPEIAPEPEVAIDPIAEISTDAMLELVEGRLKEFQAGPCSRPEMANALSHVRVAKSFMKKYSDRVARITEEAAKLSQQAGTK